MNQQKSIDIQVGTNVNETINISTSNLSPNTMGVATSYSNSLAGSDIAKSGALTYLATGMAASATLKGVSLGAAISAASDFKNNSLNLINRINTYTGDTGVTAFSFGNSLVGGSAAISVTGNGSSPITSVGAGFMTINGTQIASFAVTTAADASLQNMLTSINDQSATTGVTGYFMDATDFAVSSTASASSILVLANTNGAAIDVSLNSSVAGGTHISGAAGVLASATMSVAAGQNGKIIFNDAFTNTSVSFDGTATGAVMGVGSSSSSVSLTATSINNINVNTAASANIALLAAQKSLDIFTTQKAKLGAVLNRFDSVIRSVQNTSENIVAAKSRIMDADFATETAKMTKSLILQQAGISVLAQANQVPNNVLALLR